MCNYLEWELTAANPMLSLFETDVKEDFREQKSSYPTYPTSFVSKCAARAEASTSNSPFQERHLHPALYQVLLKMVLPVPNQEHQPKVHGVQGELVEG